MTLEVPLPIKSSNGSRLPLAGYRFHKLDSNMTITQVLSWYEDEMEAFGDDKECYSLLLCYKVAYDEGNVTFWD